MVVLIQDFCGFSWHTADTPPLERLSILRCTFYGVLWFLLITTQVPLAIAHPV